jgi:hypothetical protein
LSAAGSADDDGGDDEDSACVIAGSPIYEPWICGLYNVSSSKTGSYIRQGGSIGSWGNVRSAVFGDAVYHAWQNLSGALVSDPDCANWLAGGTQLSG